MKFALKYAGKWVAVKNEQVVASDVTLKKLTKKVAKKEKNLRFTLIPKGLIAG